MSSKVSTLALPRDELVESLAATALAHLRSEMRRLEHRSVAILIDPTLGDPLAKTTIVALALQEGRVSRHPLGFIHDDFLPERAPYLLHVADETRAERVLDESAQVALAEACGVLPEQSKGRSVCAWIVGGDEPARLAQRLAALARVARPGGQPWPLRYWDPRVFWHLPRALQPQQFRAVATALGRWYQLAPDRALVGTYRAHAGSEDRSSLPLAFDGEGWARLVRIGRINQVLDMAWEWDVHPTTANARRIDALIRRCQTLGYATEQDELVFCSCGLTSRDDFDSDPAVYEALKRGAAAGASVMQALQSFDDSDWAALRTHHHAALAVEDSPS